MLSRRQLLSSFAALPFANIAAAQAGKHSITNVQTMMMQGGRTYTLVKITANNGVFGIGEAYGSPGVGVREQIDSLKPWLTGKDPLQIDTIYTKLGVGGNNLSGARTDGSAHNLMRAASGIEMALWDLAGKLLNTPSSNLLGGRFRERVRVYDHSAPSNMMDKASCKAWAEKVKANPAGFTAHKFGFPHEKLTNRTLSSRELIAIRRGFENCREAIGFDHDILVHCHWEYDVRTAIQIAEAVESIKPLWLEDPLLVDYTSSWQRLTASSKVPICMGENLARREGFLPFVVNQGCDILNPDLRNSGGFLETKRIADFAAPFGMPIATHNTASQVHTYGNINWASTIHDYIATETVTGKGDWMDKVLLLDEPYIQGGHIRVTSKPGMGITLNPDVVRAHLAAGETWWG